VRFVLAQTLLCLLQSVEAPREEAQVVAVIYEMTGKARVGTVEDREARLFDWLRLGSRIRVDSGGRLSITFVSGARYEISGPATAELGKAGFVRPDGKISTLPSVPPLPARVALELAKLADTELGGVVLRGTGPGWIYPRRGATTLASDTTLRFGESRAPNGYRVVLEDKSGAVLLHSVVKETEVRVAPGLLQEGREYFWRVSALGEDGILGSAEAEFTTLDVATALERNRLRDQLDSESDPENLLLLAEADRAVGLFWEALATLSRARTLLPADTRLDESCEALEALLKKS
jgi:hypothetical protein